MQSRERWYNHLDPAINKGPWTRAKDDAIVTAYEEMGSKWARIAKAVGNGRADNAIKKRWNRMLRGVEVGYRAPVLCRRGNEGGGEAGDLVHRRSPRRSDRESQLMTTSTTTSPRIFKDRK